MTDALIPLLEFLLIGIPAVLLITRKLAPEERRYVRRIAFIGFALRLALSILFAAVPESRIFHEDANGYEGTGQVVASSWLGEAPPIDLSENGKVSEGRYPGFLALCSALFYIFGRFRMVVTGFMSVCGALSIVLVYRLGAQLFHRAVARRAALLTAIFPSMVLWGSMALKDPVMIFLLLIGLNAAVALRRRFRLDAVIALVAVTCAIWFIRFYVAYFLLIAVATSLLSLRGSAASVTARRISVAVLLIGCLSVVGMAGNMASSIDRLNLEGAASFRNGMVITANSGFAPDANVSTPGGALAFLPLGLAVLLLGPFPWQMTSMRGLLTLPEMLVWWAMIPALVRGVIFALRRERSGTAPLLIFAVTLCTAYALALGNVGAAYRERAQVFVFLFLFAALGQYVKHCRRRGLDPLMLRAETA